MKKTIKIIFVFCVMGVIVGYLFFINNKDNVVDTKSPTDISNVEKNKFKIIAVGDSLTAGYGLSLSESYPEILKKKLIDAGKNVEVINAGISGETTAGLLERAKFISEQNPDLLLITIGGNDVFRNLPIKNTKQNILETIKIFKQSLKAENIYLLQIEATANQGISYRDEFNGIYKEIADLEDVNLLPFVVKEVFLDQNKMLPDSIHPNKNGYEFIVDNYIFPVINNKIKK